MRRYLVRRLALALLLVWVVSTAVFMSIYLLPGDPAHIILGGDQAQPTQEQIESVRRSLGLDQPVLVRYVRWLREIGHGDLGTSLITTRPVGPDLAVRLLRTVWLVVPAAVLAVIIGVPAGIYAARRRGTLLDGLTSAVTLAGFSTPVFVAGPVLVYIFSITLPWLPPGGYPDGQNPDAFLTHLILPAVTLAAAPLATVMRMTRSSVLEQLSLDYVRTAWSKGLSNARVMRRHVLRNAYLPVVTALGLQVGAMFGGSVLVEAVFNWPGLNLFLLQAISLRDYTVIQSVVLVTATIFIVLNLMVDVTYAFLDPRIQYT